MAPGDYTYMTPSGLSAADTANIAGFDRAMIDD
jgi:hypothetical protein